MKKENWVFIKHSDAYRNGTGRYDIMKSNKDRYAVGYDARELEDGNRPNYFVYYCNTLDEAEGYASRELN